MTRVALGLAVLALAACDRTEAACHDERDCDDDALCLSHHDGDAGRCVPATGRGPTPPMRVVMDAPVQEIVFVIDDGPDAAPMQARLVDALPAFTDQLARSGLRTRVAATTTTLQQSGCDSTSAAKSGRLAATSCLDRLEDFIGPNAEDQRWACTRACTRTTSQLSIAADAPWIDLAAYADPHEAAEVLACVLPQGVSGCDRPAPLGVVEFLVRRSFEQSEAGFGLLRWNRRAQIVMASLSMDCTPTDAGQAAFDPAGPRTLWPDPSASAAPPSVCWRAGVACEGDPAVGDDCEPVDRGLDGVPVDDPADAVLLSLEPYPWEPFASFDLHVLGGVTQSTGTEGDAAFVERFGVAPACSDGTITAAPAQRLMDLAASGHDVCAADYGEALRHVAQGYEPRLIVRACMLDVLQIHERHDDGSTAAVPPCVGTEAVPEIPAQAQSCFAWRVVTAPGYDHDELHELVLRTRTPTQRVFTVTPDPWQPSTQELACDGP